MKIAICDDDKHMREKLKNMIDEYVQEEQVNEKVIILEFDSGETLLDYLEYRDKEIDILILDIIMKGLNGVQVAQEIRTFDSRLCILFLTSITNYVLEGYNVRAFRYLIKPLKYTKFKSELTSAIEEYHRFQREYIVVKNESGIYRIYFNDILYFATNGRSTLVYTHETNISSSKRMKQHLEEVDDKFYRIHEAYIINMNYVQRIVKNTVYLLNGNELPISKSRRKTFVKRLSEYLGEKI